LSKSYRCLAKQTTLSETVKGKDSNFRTNKPCFLAIIVLSHIDKKTMDFTILLTASDWLYRFSKMPKNPGGHLIPNKIDRNSKTVTFRLEQSDGIIWVRKSKNQPKI